MEAVEEVKSALNRVPELLDVPYPRIWASYGDAADVLYLNFKKPSHADDSELTDDDLIIRYEKGSVVGITVLNASKRGVACDGVYPGFANSAAWYMALHFNFKRAVL